MKNSMMMQVGNEKPRPMTAEEIAEYKRITAELPAPMPTPEERIAELEEALALLLSGVTE